jgi:thioredoxin 1
MPQILAKFQSMMQDPSQAMQAMQDPDLMKIIMKMQGLGRGGGDSGSAFGSSGSNAPAPTASPAGVASGKIHEVSTPEQYSALLAQAAKEGFPVAVDFFATWCGPCKRIAPMFQELAASYAGRAVFVKVDGDRLPSVVAANGVTGFPTFKFFGASGACEETFSGADGNRLSSTIGRLAEEAQEARSKPVHKYAHFPLLERELVFFKGVAYDKVSAKIVATLDAPDAPASLWEPAFASPAPLKAALVGLCAALQAPPTAAAAVIDDEMFLALGQLLVWPQDALGSALHLIRGLASNAAGCDGFCSGRAVPQAGKGAGAPSVVAAACRASAGSGSQTVAVLAVRAVANMFERLKMTATALRAYEDIIDLCESNLRQFAGDKAVEASSLALLINLTIALNAAAKATRKDPQLDVSAAKVRFVMSCSFLFFTIILSPFFLSLWLWLHSRSTPLFVLFGSFLF